MEFTPRDFTNLLYIILRTNKLFTALPSNTNSINCDSIIHRFSLFTAKLFDNTKEITPFGYVKRANASKSIYAMLKAKE